MDFQPQAMAQRVAESVTEAALGDQVPGQGVALSPGHTRPKLAYRPLLRRPDDLVGRLLPGVGSGAHHERTRQIGTIAIDPGAKIKQQPVPVAEYPVTGAGVRKGRPGTRGDDGGERVPLAPPPPKGGLEEGGYFVFRLPDPDTINTFDQGILRQSGGGPNRGHFLG